MTTESEEPPPVPLPPSDPIRPVRLGRPSPIDRAAPIILAAIRNGADRRTACEYARISGGLLNQWLFLARNGQEPYQTFLIDLEHAEGEAALRMMKIIFDDAHLKKNARTAMDWLKRRRREEWGDHLEVDLGIEQMARQIADLVGLPPEAIIARARELETETRSRIAVGEPASNVIEAADFDDADLDAADVHMLEAW